MARGVSPHLLWLALASVLLRFKPNLAKNCQTQHECNIVEVGCQKLFETDPPPVNMYHLIAAAYARYAVLPSVDVE